MDPQLSPVNGGSGDDDDDSEWSKPVEDFGLITSGTPKGPSCSNKDFSSSKLAVNASRNDHLRTIIHIDLDCFYAQVEMIHNPALRDVPLGIQQKYIVVTCNYPARARGVTKLMGIAEAKKKCPELVLVSGEDLTRYREMSYKVSEFLMKYTPYVERLGFDENYLDVTEMVEQRIQGGTARPNTDGHIFAADDLDVELKPIKPCSYGCLYRLAIGSQIAADIRSALNIELSITCCAGIAHNKLLAKLVGSWHKPNQQTTVYPCHALSLITGLDSARQIPGIGSATSKRLTALGIASVADLQQFPRSQLEEEFGIALAATISQLSNAIDDSPVVTYTRPQTLSLEDSFRCCNSEQDAQLRITQLITNLVPRVQEDGRTPHTFRLTVRKANKENRYSHRESRQCNLSNSVVSKIIAGKLDLAKDHLVSMAMTLFQKIVDTSQTFHLTLINVAFAKLEETAVNSIHTFFTSNTKPDLASSSTQCQSESMDHHSPHSPKSPWKKNISSSELSNCQFQNNSKRRQSNDLSCLFSKKQKVSQVPVEGAAEASRQQGNHSVKFETKKENITLPPDIDLEVFTQLPSQIQQEILQTFSKKESLNCNQTSEQNIPDLSCHVLDQSMSKLRQQDGDKGILSKKKPIFSPTKSGKGKVLSCQSSTRTASQNMEGIHNKVAEQGDNIGTLKDALKDEWNSFCETKMGRVNVAKKRISKEYPPDRSTPDSFSARLDPVLAPGAYDGMFYSGTSESETLTTVRASETQSTVKTSIKNSQTGNSLFVESSRSQLTVPRGVSPDVFSALPPEIQREVAAEMALLKHNIISPSENTRNQSKGQTKSPVKKVNSMWNYLKKK